VNTLLTCYQQPDSETLLAVVGEARKVREMGRMSRSYPKTYPIRLLRKTARRGNGIPRRILHSRDGRIRTGDPLNPIQDWD